MFFGVWGLLEIILLGIFFGYVFQEGSDVDFFFVIFARFRETFWSQSGGFCGTCVWSFFRWQKGYADNFKNLG